MSTYQNEKIPSVVNVLVSLDMIKTQLYGVVMPGLLHHGLADSVHGMQLLNISDTMAQAIEAFFANITVTIQPKQLEELTSADINLGTS